MCRLDPYSSDSSESLENVHKEAALNHSHVKVKAKNKKKKDFEPSSNLVSKNRSSKSLDYCFKFNPSDVLMQFKEK